MTQCLALAEARKRLLGNNLESNTDEVVHLNLDKLIEYATETGIDKIIMTPASNSDSCPLTHDHATAQSSSFN
jgi:hypothetical protein